MRAIIIDDEVLARDIVSAYIKDFPEIEVIGECSNGFEGVKMINEQKPDLIFLDIQMPKITGFEMLELLDHEPLVIFSTAFDQYAIKAFELSATDYLLKPYDKGRFAEAIAKVKEKFTLQTSDHTAKTPIIYPQQEDVLDRIVVKLGNKINIISTEEIIYIEAQDDYVSIHTTEAKYLKQITMKYLEAHLPQDQFVRTHRSYIAAINAIDKIEVYEKESYILHLKHGAKINVSRSGYSKLKQVLNF
jgi:two-component system LytT family response regulator